VSLRLVQACPCSLDTVSFFQDPSCSHVPCGHDGIWDLHRAPCLWLDPPPPRICPLTRRCILFLTVKLSSSGTFDDGVTRQFNPCPLSTKCAWDTWLDMPFVPGQEKLRSLFPEFPSALLYLSFSFPYLYPYASYLPDFLQSPTYSHSLFRETIQ
jgi:hypothetical protein